MVAYVLPVVGRNNEDRVIPQVPYDKFIDYYDKIMDYVPMDSAVIVYCTSVTCDLGDKLATELQLMGYEKVVVYRGGWEEWSEAEYPGVTGSDPE